MARFYPETLISLGPYHLLSWGSLLGMELYQSFILTKLCYWHLPMPQFTHLQKKVFPVYFQLQTGLAALTIATYPPASLYSLTFKASWIEWVPLVLNLSMAGLNWWVWGPRTTEAMVGRTHQETKDSRRRQESASASTADNNTKNLADQAEESKALLGPSEDMVRIRKLFSKNHAMAIHLNAIALIGTVWYGIVLGGKLKFD